MDVATSVWPGSAWAPKKDLYVVQVQWNNDGDTSSMSDHIWER